jgi:hypothetical protein
MLFGLDFGEFGVWTQSAVYLSRPKAFLQDTLYDTCTHFQLPGTHGVRRGLSRVFDDVYGINRVRRLCA